MRKLSGIARTLIMAAMMASFSSPARAGLVERFQQPLPTDLPKERWWFPSADLDVTELNREILEMKAAGFQAAELSFLPSAGDPGLAQFGWDQPAWPKALELAMTAAAANGFTLDFTLGPAWPLSSSLVTSTADPRVEQELITTAETVAAEAAISRDLVPPLGDAVHLVAVTAAALSAPTGTKPILLDFKSAQNLAAFVSGTHLNWKAPAGAAAWKVFASWSRATGQTTLHPTGAAKTYVLDHFSDAASEALASSWDSQIWTPAAKSLLGKVGGDVFGDSLEIAADLFWTSKFLNEFKIRRGYDVTPYLAVLRIENLQQVYAGFTGGARDPGNPADFDFAGGIGARVRNDYYHTLSDLMEQEHLAELASWAHDHGLRLRYQPAYGQTLNLISNAKWVDVPESENLHSGNQIDYHRAMAASAHVMGKPVVSLECCATIAADYAQTPKQALQTIETGIAGGVNQIVFHGRPYLKAGAAWPGWQPFSPAPPLDFSEAWDSRQPFWPEVHEAVSYLGRVQAMMHEGTAKVDVAIYRDSYWWPATRWFYAWSSPAFFADQGLARAGYTYDFVDPSLVDLMVNGLPGISVYELGLPSYHALVLDQVDSLPLATAQQFLFLASHGYSFVVVGEAPRHTPGLDLTGDSALAGVLAQFLAQPNVKRVATEQDVPAALAAMGVASALQPQAASALLSARRAKSDENIYYLVNSGNQTLQTSLSVIGSGRAYWFDAWAGSIRVASTTAISSVRMRVPVELAPHQSALLVLSPHAIVAADLNSGSTNFALPLEKWRLNVTSADPSVPPVNLSLEGLKDWRSIPELASSAGVGSYTADFAVPANCVLDGARLLLGDVEGAAQLKMNGAAIPPLDPFAPAIDISPYLHAENNQIEIDLATTLRNRVITLWQKGWAAQWQALLKAIGATAFDLPYVAEPSGLLGPISLRLNCPEVAH